MELKNERLTEVFKRLEKISGYKIMFTYDDISQMSVNGTIDSSDVKEVMNMIIGDKPLDYRVDGQFIYVTLRERVKKANNELQKEILLVVLTALIVSSYTPLQSNKYPRVKRVHITLFLIFFLIGSQR